MNQSDEFVSQFPWKNQKAARKAFDLVNYFADQNINSLMIFTGEKKIAPVGWFESNGDSSFEKRQNLKKIFAAVVGALQSENIDVQEILQEIGEGEIDGPDFGISGEEWMA